MAENETDAAPEKAPGSKLKWIILILILLVVLGGIGAAVYFFFFHDSSESEDATAEVAGEAAGPAAPAQPQAPLIYHELEPFTVNITKPGPIRFLRLKLTVVTRDEAVAAAVDKHVPRIRNDLLSMLATQEFSVMNTPEGKDALREQLKEHIASILTQVGEPSALADVLFTDFVMQ